MHRPLSSPSPPGALRGRAEQHAAFGLARLSILGCAAVPRLHLRIEHAVCFQRSFGPRLEGWAPSPGDRRGAGGCPLSRGWCHPPPNRSRAGRGAAQSPRMPAHNLRGFSRLRISVWQGRGAASQTASHPLSSFKNTRIQTHIYVNTYLTFYLYFCI